jgi:hypothetical protein
MITDDASTKSTLIDQVCGVENDLRRGRYLNAMRHRELLVEGQGHTVGSFHGSRRSRSSHLLASASLNSHFFGSQRSTV